MCLPLQIWDFKTAQCEAAMAGHGGDVKACDWHPAKSVVASGSKDTVVKLWDARAGGRALATLHGHKATIMQVGACSHLGRVLPISCCS